MMLVKHAVLCVAAVAVPLFQATPAVGQASVSLIRDAVLTAEGVEHASGAFDAPAGLRASGPALALAPGSFPFPVVAKANGDSPVADVGLAPAPQPGSRSAPEPNAALETESAGVAPGPAAPSAPSAPLGAEVPSAEMAPTATDARASGLVRAEAAQGLRFRAAQLREPRVAGARRRAEANVRALFTERGLRYPAQLFFRVFKKERVFELWALDPAEDRYVLVREYPVCAVSGHLGPKRQAGDRQVPEGFYDIDLLNPRSRYHLSMRVNYPNAVDLELSRADRPGGDIYVHGGCSTVGCVPVTDEAIEELYWLAVEARAQGQTTIPIHIFPTRMDGPAMRELAELSAGDDSTWRLWLSLEAGYDYFETHRRLPEIGHLEGYYSVGG